MLRTTTGIMLTACTLLAAACSGSSTGPVATFEDGGAPASARDGGATAQNDSGTFTGTDAAGPGADPDSGGPAPGGSSVVATVNGETITFDTSVNTVVSHPAQLPMSQWYAGFTATASMQRSVTVTFSGDKPGMFTCGSGNHVEVQYSDSKGLVAGAKTCDIVVTELGGPGGKMVGTFVSSTAPATTKVVEIMNGTFSINLPN